MTAAGKATAKTLFAPLANFADLRISAPADATEEPVLPMLAAARERDAAARAALKAGGTLATAQDAAELRAWRGRGRR